MLHRRHGKGGWDLRSTTNDEDRLNDNIQTFEDENDQSLIKENKASNLPIQLFQMDKS